MNLLCIQGWPDACSSSLYLPGSGLQALTHLGPACLYDELGAHCGDDSYSTITTERVVGGEAEVSKPEAMGCVLGQVWVSADGTGQP